MHDRTRAGRDAQVARCRMGVIASLPHEGLPRRAERDEGVQGTAGWCAAGIHRRPHSTLGAIAEPTGGTTTRHPISPCVQMTRTAGPPCGRPRLDTEVTDDVRTWSLWRPPATRGERAHARAGALHVALSPSNP